MSDFQIKAGDRLPALSTQLTRSDGAPVDLTGAVVTFVMRDLTAAAAKVSSTAVTFGDRTQGQVTYFWAPGDTDTPGIYDGSWKVTFLDGKVQSFPTDDYLEIEVQLDLAAAGTTLRFRPTDGIRPPVSAVAAVLPQRGKERSTGNQFTENTTPRYSQVQSIIDSVAGEVDGEFDGVAITPALARLARWAIVCAAAATVELSFFPEQASNGGDTSAIWWSRYQSTMTRLRALLTEEGDGPAMFGSTVLVGHAVAAANAYAATLSAAGLLPDVWTTPPETWY